MCKTCQMVARVCSTSAQFAEGWRRLEGHAYTIVPALWRGAFPLSLPPGEAWTVPIEDARVPSQALRAVLHLPHAQARVGSMLGGHALMSGDHALGEQIRAGLSRPPLVLLLHGLGGDAGSPYVREFTLAALRHGCAVLRVHLRGADHQGRDFYHAGLTRDLHALVDAALHRGFAEMFWVGFSLGGHLVLRALVEGHAPLPRAAVAFCPPLDLARCARHLDTPRCALYRAWILRSLREMLLRALARSPSLAASVPAAARIRRVRSMQAWDEEVVAPRHGFASAEAYWARHSVHTSLDRISVPTWMLHADYDPVLPSLVADDHFPGAVWHEAHAADASTSACVRVGQVTPWVTHSMLGRGGHVGYPQGLCVPTLVNALDRISEAAARLRPVPSCAAPSHAGSSARISPPRISSWSKLASPKLPSRGRPARTVADVAMQWLLRQS